MANALPFKTDRSADTARSFAAGFGATDLTAQGAGFPDFGPQYTEVHNANEASSQSAILTLENGETFTVVVAPGETRPVPVPITDLQAGGGADISVNCYWWTVPGKDDYQYMANPSA